MQPTERGGAGGPRHLARAVGVRTGLDAGFSMAFLQPLLLAALPLAALPIIIHLINQRRYQTVRWGAMMFLLAAQRMSRGYTRIRQWLILLFRVAAVAGLLFAVARPLAGGWLGFALGGRPDTTIILLDRSPSMQQQADGVASKLESGRRQLAFTLEKLGSARWVLIDSSTNQPREIESPSQLLERPDAGPVDASADLPAMLESAYDYIVANKTGQTDVWICSDLKSHDWKPDGGRWQAVREALASLPQSVRIHLLAYPEVSSANTAIQVTGVRRSESADGAHVLVSLKLTRAVGSDVRTETPIRFEIEGASTELKVEMVGPTYELKDHRIPLAGGQETGWGRATIPADENPADNHAYFVFDKERERRTLIVTDDAEGQRALQIAASIAPAADVQCTVEAASVEQFASADLSGVGLILWHAQPPGSDQAKILQSVLDREGQILFFPPAHPAPNSFLGVVWQEWADMPEGAAVQTWRADQELLANTQSGASLPVGALQIRRYCRLQGDVIALATLQGGDPLLARLPTDHGGVYFCSTTASPSDSTLAANGVVLYVVVQRALAAGASQLGNARLLVAGARVEAGNWKRLAGSDDALSTAYPHHAGVYADDNKLLAVNRAAAEDEAGVVDDGRIAKLFERLDFTRVDGSTGTADGLIQEVWRVFLLAMMVALIAEAMLSLPRSRQSGDQERVVNWKKPGVDRPNSEAKTVQAI